MCASHVPGPRFQEGLVDLDLDLTHSIRDGGRCGGLCLEEEGQGAECLTPFLRDTLCFCLLLSQPLPPPLKSEQAEYRD